jgi:hypothetical protein
VLISGEPGIGKSRLAEAFRQSVIGEPHARLRYFCSPHLQDSALFPIIAQLARAAGFEGGDTTEAKLDKLEALIAANAPAEGDVPLLAELLPVPFEGRYAALDLTPQRKKEKTFEALLRQLADLARRQPVLVIFEDLHWADPTSRELPHCRTGRTFAGAVDRDVPPRDSSVLDRPVAFDDILSEAPWTGRKRRVGSRNGRQHRRAVERGCGRDRRTQRWRAAIS